MTERIIKDANGRTWTCTAAETAGEGAMSQGRDVVLSCATPSVDAPVSVKVGWNWASMAENGLARMVSQLSPAAKA